jgi:hypothetical protein
MALHALWISSVEDWAVPAREWLISKQNADGYWKEPESPDPVWLTVLVLDALEMVSGGNKLTYRMGRLMKNAPLVFVAYQHGDRKRLEIEFFDDSNILAGAERAPEIRAKLNSARIIVILISSIPRLKIYSEG